MYAVLSPYLNHFVASRRVIEKFEVNEKWKNKYEKVVKTPYQRVMGHPDIYPTIKEKFKLEHGKLNSAVMKKEIDRLKAILYDLQRKHGKTKK